MQAIPLELRYVIPERGYEKFWEGLKKGEIWATKCKRCGSLYYPPQRDCPVCMTSELEWYRLSDRGELMTYTVVKAKPQGYEDREDYTIGIVRTEDGVDLMCWIKGVPRVGSKVRLGTDGDRVVGETA
ncbi:MAG: Zn-ribbon domain-containing OB-fold protein [Metallosphaera yellowstonensis]|jgi:Predicted nucleic-acid-binding protein containing a Zn-ribbon|uniref:Putative nucleic-acid-binding protein containing a Zn-ribbon n=1 Tax=Metallosphaera yellowstonensis MK1 TaxID=671065 RepID=H2C147_9CREN|nr:Zn-ribbon domain-containing OB-fold protein [Metallosphaera yellowstonensis]EHP71143.1 putative nucleic-acid-binding protein containing a Zn-ribbon [Metallosphaera yellowstonensis MK1]